MTDTNETIPTAEQVLEQLAARVTRMEAKPTTQWLYRVLEQDDDGDPLDFGAVSAATLVEAQQLVTQHLANILGDDGWEGLPVRFYPVTGTTGVWASDQPYVDTELDLTSVEASE